MQQRVTRERRLCCCDRNANAWSAAASHPRTAVLRCPNANASAPAGYPRTARMRCSNANTRCGCGGSPKNSCAALSERGRELAVSCRGSEVTTCAALGGTRNVLPAPAADEINECTKSPTAQLRGPALQRDGSPCVVWVFTHRFHLSKAFSRLPGTRCSASSPSCCPNRARASESLASAPP